MRDRDIIECEGTIVRIHRGDFCEVEVTIGAVRRTVRAKRSGRMNVGRIQLCENDRVRVEVSPYDLSRGRITYRL